MSAAPEGWSILKVTSIVFPGRTVRVGRKPARWYVSAAPIVGAAGGDEDEEQPPAKSAATARIEAQTRSARTCIRQSIDPAVSGNSGEPALSLRREDEDRRDRRERGRGRNRGRAGSAGGPHSDADRRG